MKKCDRIHITSYETQVINCAKALVRAQRKSKIGLEASFRDEKCFFHMRRLTTAVEALEDDEERTRVKNRDYAAFVECLEAEEERERQQPRTLKKSQKAQAQKTKQATRIDRRRPGDTKASYRTSRRKKRT